MEQKFKYNPFSGVFDEEIEEIIVPRFDMEEILSNVDFTESRHIEFLGKKGRGKTTHLAYLHQLKSYFPIFYLDKNSSLLEIITHPSKIVLVDGIHQLNFYDRVKLFRIKKTVIYTTHYSRIIECFFAKKKKVTYRFKGINAEELYRIINKRFVFALKTTTNEEAVSIEEVELLIKKFQDNYRGIINYMYEQYQ